METIEELKKDVIKYKKLLSYKTQQYESLKSKYNLLLYKLQSNVIERALTYACEELEDAKEMLREAGKPDWANVLNTSEDYFKAKAKELKDEQ